MASDRAKAREDEPVSLAPLDAVAALRALLQVDPDAKGDDGREDQADERDEGPAK